MGAFFKRAREHLMPESQKALVSLKKAPSEKRQNLSIINM
jgi:hypothetical protein